MMGEATRRREAHFRFERMANRDPSLRLMGDPMNPEPAGGLLASSCEWNPTTDDLALTDEPHHAHAEFSVRNAYEVVGEKLTLQLCRACASLPRFANLKRKPLATPATQGGEAP